MLYWNIKIVLRLDHWWMLMFNFLPQVFEPREIRTTPGAVAHLLLSPTTTHHRRWPATLQPHTGHGQSSEVPQNNTVLWLLLSSKVHFIPRSFKGFEESFRLNWLLWNYSLMEMILEFIQVKAKRILWKVSSLTYDSWDCHTIHFCQ